jgi:ribonuclease P protein component
MFKLAVQRNRAKRLLRDWIAFSENLMIPELDYIIIARSNILECNRDNGRALIFSAFKKLIGLYNNAKPR